jgi:hypothetical protein
MLNFPSRSYVANATAGTLATPIISTTTTFTSSTSLAEWSDVTGGSLSGDLVIAVEYGTSNQENILCTYAGSTFTILERNYNDETAFDTTTAHPASSTFVVIFSATEAAEAQAAVQSLKPNVLMNVGTTTEAQDVTVASVSSTGSSQYAAAADHVHTLSSANLNSYFASAGVSLSCQAGNIIYGQQLVSSSAYTASTADVNNIIVCTNTSAATITLPSSTSVQFGQSITIVRLDTAVTITGSGVVSTGATVGSPNLRAVGSCAQAISLGVNGWVVTGDIA